MPHPRPQRRNVGPMLGLTLAASALGACFVPVAHASQLVPQNLKQMIQVSDLIVSGEVTKVTDGIDKGVPFTEVTLKVKGSLKRKLATQSSYRIRQYGLLRHRRMADGRYLLAARIEGMPTWTVGETVTTFMNKPAAHTGLMTPVGLAQGKFTLSGSRLSNGFDNRDLFKGVSVDPRVLKPSEAAMLSQRSGALDANVLHGLVKRALAEQWIERGVMR